MVRERGIGFTPLPGEFLALLDTPQGKAAIAGSNGFGAGMKLLKHVKPLMRRLLDLEWEGVRAFAPDALVYHPKSLGSPHIASRLDLPSFLASPLPGFTPTSTFPSPILPFASLGPLNGASHRMAAAAGNLLFGRLLNQWREETLNLRRGRGRRPLATLYAYSRHVVPVPPDWGPDVLVSGYWFLNASGWEPPQRLTAFLDAGEPPVYVGFGSMPGIEPHQFTRTVLKALELTGSRGLLASGGGALGAADLPSSVHLIDAAPHDLLLPRCAAAVHHGGAGTTGATLRAGIPTAICPFFGDQPFWARRVAALGAGPPPLKLKSLTAEALATAISTMKQSNMRAAAAALGTAIGAEDGVSSSVRFIEERAHPT